MTKFDNIFSKLRIQPLLIQQLIIIIAFIILILLVTIYPNPLEINSDYIMGEMIYTGVLLILISLFIVWLRFSKNTQKISDIFTIIAFLFIVWEIVTRFALIDIIVFPPPTKVFGVYAVDYEKIILGIFSSLSILISGYILAIILAIPFGLLIGWKKRLHDFAYPLAKGLSPIPPMVYVPYAIILLPTFFLSSVFVIFIGAFWPILLGVITGVFNISPKIINSAKTLGLSDLTMIRRILLPGAMPHIFTGAFIGLIIAFITLLIGEVIGSSVGMGWYLQHNAQFARYDAILAGMIVISIVVIMVTSIFDKVQNYLLRWVD